MRKPATGALLGAEGAAGGGIPRVGSRGRRGGGGREDAARAEPRGEVRGADPPRPRRPAAAGSPAPARERAGGRRRAGPRWRGAVLCVSWCSGWKGEAVPSVRPLASFRHFSLLELGHVVLELFPGE